MVSQLLKGRENACAQHLLTDKISSKMISKIMTLILAKASQYSVSANNRTE